MPEYSIEAVARMARCPVDPVTFLKVRPCANLTLNSLNRRCRSVTGFPGAFRIPGSRQWSIDLVTYDKVVGGMLEENVASIQKSIDAVRDALPSDLRGMASDDNAIMDKVYKRLQQAGLAH